MHSVNDSSPIQLVVALALVDSDQRILVQMRPAHDHLAGLWEFPGGKVEPGEHPAQALSREIVEELNVLIDPRAMVPCGFSTIEGAASPLLLLLYVARADAGTVDAVPNWAEHIRWVTLDELGVLPMPPADVPLVTQLAALLVQNPSTQPHSEM